MKDISQLSDEALAGLAQGDARDVAVRRAAGELLGRYRGPVYGWALRYMKNHERALDMAQDVLLSAWRNRESFQGRSRFFAWIFAITRNHCLNALRRPELLRDEGVEVDRLAARRPGPEQELADKLDGEEILNLIQERLDMQEQDAIYLRCFERMPLDEITELLGISGTTGARSVLQRARRKLREALVSRRRNQG